MASEPDNTSFSDSELLDLSSLADGSINPARRAAVEARIAQSAELTALYERERTVVDLLHRAAATDRAPASLRARLQEQRPSAKVRARRRFTYAGALAGAIAAVALALALILPGGAPGSPSVSLAAALANQGATSPPPAPNTEAPTARLGDRVEDVYFPNWGGVFHAVATGQRVDKINGRRAVTVFYDLNGKRVAYTIVAEPALAEPNADVTRVNGIELRTLKINGRTVVTWRRDDHTCVLSGPGVSPHQLQRLAGWSKVDE